MGQEKIKSIKLNKFRGATQPFEINFNLKKSMIMIFGENGTGKSTIVDAMDFIFNKECGSLKEKSSTKIKSHLPSLGSYSQDVEVFISSQNYQWKGKLNGSNPEIKGGDHLPLLKILRRSKILELVNAEPKKRYEALKNFIELPHIRSSENSLRENLREIDRNINSATSTNQSQKDTLQKSWEGEGKPGDNYLQWAEKESRKQVHELKEKINQYTQCIDLIKKIIESWDYFKKSKEKLPLSKNKLDIARQTLKEQSRDNQLEEIIDILQKTQSFLEKKESDECPACEQPITPNKLKERIAVRLKDIQELITLREDCSEAEKEYNIV
ncbi:MAG: ATP-binding protein, partial [Bdellovibrionales bacterium]|nr:ATP-binding protein [Bdellovibrionales bacterium]